MSQFNPDPRLPLTGSFPQEQFQKYNIPSADRIKPLIEIIETGEYPKSAEAADELVKVSKDKKHSNFKLARELLAEAFNETTAGTPPYINCLNALVQLRIGQGEPIEKDNPCRSIEDRRWEVYDILTSILKYGTDGIHVYKSGALHTLAGAMVEEPCKPSSSVVDSLLTLSLKSSPKHKTDYIGQVAAELVTAEPLLFDEVLKSLTEEVTDRTSTKNIEPYHLNGIAFAFGAISTCSKGCRQQSIAKLLSLLPDSNDKMSTFVGNALYQVQKQGIGIEDEIVSALKYAFNTSRTAFDVSQIAKAYAQFASKDSSLTRRFFKFCKNLIQDGTPDFIHTTALNGVTLILDKGFAVDKDKKIVWNNFWYKQFKNSELLDALVDQFPGGEWVLHSKDNRAVLLDSIHHIINTAYDDDSTTYFVKSLARLIPELHPDESNIITERLNQIARNDGHQDLECARALLIKHTLLDEGKLFSPAGKLAIIKTILAMSNTNEGDEMLYTRLNHQLNRIPLEELSEQNIPLYQFCITETQERLIPRSRQSKKDNPFGL
jgi:hypothetical protein